MKKEQTVRGKWTKTRNRRFSYIGKLSTPKGFGFIMTNEADRIVVKVLLRVVVNLANTVKWAQVESNEIEDITLAQLFVEGLLL